MMRIKKTKFRAWFFTKINDIPMLSKKKKFKLKQVKEGIINVKGIDYAPNFNNPTFSNGLKQFFFFTLGKREQIMTNNVDIEKDSHIKGQLYKRKVIEHFISAIGQRLFKLNWLHLVLGMIATGVIGYVIAGFLPFPS